MSEVPSKTDLRAMHGLVFFSLLVFTALVPALHSWPLFWAFPLGCYFLLARCVPPLRRSFRQWHFGRVTSFTLTATAIISLVACGTLVTYQLLVNPALGELGRVLSTFVTFGGVLWAGIGFSICNALLEELAFRGIFFDAAESQSGPVVAILVTAVLFGYGHMGGYPPGPLGALLAGIYGVALGWLRYISKGLGLPFISHIAADATIFAILARAGAFR